ncbi:hypothetical protein NQ318_016320 [Aromia moschata]|uniref:Uncharacterized protein n=1 Tax=Aromia moschata TaxID=1265417 RepID=A0AAV8Z527_9CUCU|nr:hypothetical protein NQ318_016320 [Aromia moschata]
MQRSLEQRMAIKFCVKLEKSAAETIPMLKKAFDVDCLSDSSDDDVKRVRDLLNTDRRLSVRLISETLDITKTIVHEIVLESLGIRKVCAKLVPKVLTDDQKARRVETCQELLDTCEDNPAFLDDVITGVESWVFEYDPEWHTSNSLRHKKAWMSRSKIKTMLIVFFYCRGLVHHEFVPQGTTVTGKFYVEVLKTFFLFPRLKTPMKGQHFGSVKNIQKACTDTLKAIPENDYRLLMRGRLAGTDVWTQEECILKVSKDLYT